MTRTGARVTRRIASSTRSNANTPVRITTRTETKKSLDQDNWNNDYENRLQPGHVLDPDMRRMSRPAPDGMTRGMGRPPHGYRYVVIGGHVVLIDSGYRVHDAIHFEVNVGH